ncbi:MAG: FAD-dependent pyridine nucleotide-disulfide oxidoreductase [Clostridia bacterium]|jgi:thioredoxin reductase (NADPH)|nr:FAD-dependent pyridine nucleotide-disulfide oxidoreductase [Clostridia bacterium]
MFDVAVIGGGPAGLSAALNLKIRNKSFVLLGGTEKVTGLMKAPQIDNYLGLVGISGTEMLNTFKKHTEEMGIEIKHEKVQNILNMGDYFALNAGAEFYEAKAIIIATGHAKANYMPGEKEYLGRGVGYCATCDGPLYRNKPVAIISENEEGEEEANFLSELCSEVYYIPLYDGDYKTNEKVKLVKEKAQAIEGNETKANLLRTANSELSVEAIFIVRNVIPIGQLIEGLEIEEGSIKIDKNMAGSIPGVFACGDCTGKPYQIAKAVGDGSTAALNAVKYIDLQKMK